MKQTLSDLWRGEIRPIDAKAEDGEEVKELRGSIETCYNILWSKLDSDGKQVLDKLRACHAELESARNEESFVQGFSLAVKMMNEAIAD